MKNPYDYQAERASFDFCIPFANPVKSFVRQSRFSYISNNNSECLRNKGYDVDITNITLNPSQKITVEPKYQNCRLMDNITKSKSIITGPENPSIQGKSKILNSSSREVQIFGHDFHKDKDSNNLSLVTSPIITKDNPTTDNINKFKAIFCKGSYDKISINEKVKIVLTLNDLRIDQNKIRRAIYYGNPSNLNEALDCIFEGEDGFWQHKFVESPSSLTLEPAIKSFDFMQGEKNDISCQILKEKKSASLELINSGIIYNNGEFEKTFNSSYISIKIKEANTLLKINNYYDNSITFTANEFDFKDAKICAICNDILEKHSPDFNLELIEKQEIRKHPNLVKPLSILSIINVEEIGDSKQWYKCIICMDNSKKIKLQNYFNCYHSLCESCFSKYIKDCCLLFPLSVKCPSSNCNSSINLRSLIGQITFIDLFPILKKAGKRNQYFKNSIIFCPKCGKQVRINFRSIDNRYTCEFCAQKICGLCYKKWHGNFSCEENQMKRFIHLTRGQPIQFCTKCYEPTIENRLSNKMECQKCQNIFCRYCMKSGNENHNNIESCLFNAPSKCIQKKPINKIEEENQLVKKEKKKATLKIILTIIIGIIFLPLIDCILGPFLFAVNISNILMQKNEYYILAKFKRRDKMILDPLDSFNNENLIKARENEKFSLARSLISWISFIFFFIIGIILIPVWIIISPFLFAFSIYVYINKRLTFIEKYFSSHILLQDQLLAFAR